MSCLTDEDFASYEEARNLTEETSNTDPESEPFKSKYKARELLQGLKNNIENAIEEHSPEEWTLQSACLLYHLGLNYTETEEISSGEEYLGRCNQKLADFHTNPKCVVTVIGTLNQLGIIWFKRTETQKSLEFLKEAEKIYHEFTSNVDEVPWGVHDLFRPESSHKPDHERKAEFENIHTLTLYYLAQVYGKLEQSLKSAKLCNITLKRQLESGQYDPMDWALNSATLSQYFLMRDDYHRARHCLASASCIFQEVLQKHPEAVEMTGDEVDGDVEEIQHRKADIAMCWLKYCVALLTFSADEDEPSEDVGGNDDDGEAICGEDHEDYKIPEKFHTLELDTWEDKVPDSKAETFEAARKLFLAGQQFVTESKQYYVFDGHVSDYIEIVQDHSKLFRLLTRFEPDLERRCKMHKRRIDLLVPIIEEVNPQFFLHILQQLTFEVGETYNHMVDLKLEIKHQTEGTPTPHAIKKINTLISKAIESFKKFHDLLRNPQGVMPEQFEENLVRPALIAHFYIARLYGKYISSEMADRIQWLETSCEHYKFVADYCKKYPAARKVVEAEAEMCDEMVQFTPVRIDSMRRGIF